MTYCTGSSSRDLITGEGRLGGGSEALAEMGWAFTLGLPIRGMVDSPLIPICHRMIVLVL